MMEVILAIPATFSQILPCFIWEEMECTYQLSHMSFSCKWTYMAYILNLASNDENLVYHVVRLFRFRVSQIRHINDWLWTNCNYYYWDIACPYYISGYSEINIVPLSLKWNVNRLADWRQIEDKAGDRYGYPWQIQQ